MMPKARQQLIKYGAWVELILQPTFIASPKAQAEKKSATHGITMNDAARLNRDTNCIFFLISSVMFISINVTQMGRVHEGAGQRKWLSTTILRLIRRKFVSVFSTIVILPIFLQQIIMQVQYRNCNYIGDFNSQQYERQGYGMLIFDNSHIIMAKWKSDIINGPFVMITDRMRVLGTMVNNKLEGYNVISVQESLVSNKKEKERTIYGMFRENKLYGKALIIDGDDVIIAHYTDGKLREVSDKKPIKEKQVFDMLQVCFPNETYTIADWLVLIFAKTTKEANADSTAKFEPVYRKFEGDTHFYGYAEIFVKNKAVGFLMHQGEVISIGDHQDDYLQGLGRLYHSDGTVEDGVFKQGQLCGIGISYSKKNHKFILGEHNQENDSFEKGFGFPQKQISQIRKEFHLRSINFYNDIVMFSFSTLFEAISVNCLSYNIDNQSPRFSSLTNNFTNGGRHGLPQKSPLRAKIAHYQQESQHIDDPSPIKNKPINQYDRADHRRSKYFQNEQQNGAEEPIQNRHKPNSRSKTELNRPRDDDSRLKNNSKKIKDTKQLVKQLDEKQKTRRGYLDQIYKEAKLYSRKN